MKVLLLLVALAVVHRSLSYGFGSGVNPPPSFARLSRALGRAARVAPSSSGAVSRSSSSPRAPSLRLEMAAGDGDSNPFYKGQDAYQILEIPKNADKKDIKSAYKKSVAKWHPDKFPDDEEKKKEGGLRMEKVRLPDYTPPFFFVSIDNMYVTSDL